MEVVSEGEMAGVKAVEESVIEEEGGDLEAPDADAVQQEVQVCPSGS